MPKSATPRKPKPKKNESLSLLRAVTKSMAGAIPGISDETRDTAEDTLARVTGGVASQVMGEDPETGELVFPPLHNIKRMWNADSRRKAGLPRQKQVMPGLVQDTLSLPTLGDMVGAPVPQFARDAQESADRIHSGVNDSMGLEAPEGFRQNAADSLGVMLGQAPVPGKAKVEAVKDLGGGALKLLKRYGKKALTSPIEFFSPTVHPSPSNYASGAIFGGAMGSAADNAGAIAQFLQAMGNQPIPKDPRLPDWEPRPERLPDLDYEDLPEITMRAKGGKVGALTQMLKAIHLNPDSQTLKRVPYQIGEPIEEVLYAVNEGQRKGVLSSDEAKRIKVLLDVGDDETLADALLDLHQRLQMKAAEQAKQLPAMTPPPAIPRGGPRELPHERLDREGIPYSLRAPEPAESGRGKLTQEEFDRLVLKRGQ